MGRSGVVAEYGRGDLVDPDIGALGRKHRGDQQLQGVGEVQGDVGVPVMLLQQLQNGADLPGWVHKEPLISMSNKKQFFVILSVAKNLSFKAAEIRNEAALRSE